MPVEPGALTPGSSGTNWTCTFPKGLPSSLTVPSTESLKTSTLPQPMAVKSKRANLHDHRLHFRIISSTSRTQWHETRGSQNAEANRRVDPGSNGSTLPVAVPSGGTPDPEEQGLCRAGSC